MDKKKLTTNQGAPIADNQNSRTAGAHGPILLEDYQLVEKLAHFNRERVPERVVHARGFGAHGVFTVTKSMKDYTSAHFLQNVGQETPVFARLSTVIHGLHSPETLRDPRGFAVKFYTEEGNYDFVGNNLPVFFIRDAIKFPDVIHSLKPDPRTNMQDPVRYWDFMSLTPEATNMLIHLFTDEGIPASYRTMRGSSVHAYKWINADGETTYVKIRFIPQQGIINLSMEDAERMQAHDFNHATRDTYTAIENGDYPVWDVCAQFLDPKDMDNYDYFPLDATKDWPEEDFPYVKFGEMILNKNVENVFAETESVGFNPGVLVPGMLPSEDKLLQGRLFAYSDSQRHRIGPNYLQLPINAPHVPVHNNQRDSYMPYRQQTHHINFEPNSHEDTPKEQKEYAEVPQPLAGSEALRHAIEKTCPFAQAGRIYRSYSPETKEALIKNLVHDLKPVKEKRMDILERVLHNFGEADSDLAMALATGLGVEYKG